MAHPDPDPDFTFSTMRYPDPNSDAKFVPSLKTHGGLAFDRRGRCFQTDENGKLIKILSSQYISKFSRFISAEEMIRMVDGVTQERGHTFRDITPEEQAQLDAEAAATPRNYYIEITPDEAHLFREIESMPDGPHKIVLQRHFDQILSNHKKDMEKKS